MVNDAGTKENGSAKRKASFDDDTESAEGGLANRGGDAGRVFKYIRFGSVLGLNLY